MPRWTEESRKQQSQLIRGWQPWKKSTGPVTQEGKAIASKNRCPMDFLDFHGIRIRSDTKRGKKMISQLMGTLANLRLGLISADECHNQVLDLLRKNGYLESEKHVEHAEN